MGKIITALFGAGFFGSILVLRKYLGIALIMIVAASVFKTDIVEYFKYSSKQAHEERLAQLQIESERMKLTVAEKAKQEAQEKIDIELQKKEMLRLELEMKQEQRKEEQRKEKARIRQKAIDAANSEAHDRLCIQHYAKWTEQMMCANLPHSYSCTNGAYSKSAWLNGANIVRSNAISDGCSVNY